METYARAGARRAPQPLSAASALAGALLLAAPAAGQIVPVGAGSYTTLRPAGQHGPSVVTSCSPYNPAPAGPAPIKKTAAVTGALPTNDWWSSLLFQRCPEDPWGTPIFPDPLAVDPGPQGLGIAYPTYYALNHEYHALYMPNDLELGVQGLSAPDTRVDGYSDWSVSALWNDGTRLLRTTLVRGSPYLYATLGGGPAELRFNGPLTVWSNQGAVLGVSVQNPSNQLHHYGLFAPAGATWTQAGNVLRSSLAGQGYLTLAVLPDSSAATLAFYRRYAYAFVTGTRVSWSYDEATARVHTRYEVTTAPREGSETRTLMGAYRHQWLHTQDRLAPYSYATARGEVKMHVGRVFTTTRTFGGVLPALPDRIATPADRARLWGYVDAVYQGIGVPGDSYWAGKALGKMAALVRVADQVGHAAARDFLLARMKQVLQDWLRADDGNGTLFHYDATWGLLVGYPSSYNTDQEVNDHNFHWGYMLSAAAAIAQYDPAWAAESQWGGMLRLLIADVANADPQAEPRFPRLRSFDPYIGHSYASGHGHFNSGNNQESSSESMNFNTALILWGAAVGDTALRDLGIWMYANEADAIEQYWFDVDEAVFPAAFEAPYIAIRWDDGGAYGTWWTGNPEEVQGINLLPLTGGSLYLGRRGDYFPSWYSYLLLRNGGPEEEWRDIIWEYQALYDPVGALAKFDAQPGYVPEAGETRAHTYHWIRNLLELGEVDTSVTADVPTYAVFLKGAVRTHVAYNPGASPRDVHFSDGVCLRVAPRSMTVVGACAPGH